MYTVPKLEDFSPENLKRLGDELNLALKAESGAVTTEMEYTDFRNRWMARNNSISAYLVDEWLKRAPNENKREVGQLVNTLKARILDEVTRECRVRLDVMLATGGRKGAPTKRPATGQSAIAASGTIATNISTSGVASIERAVDISLPGIERPLGVRHPVLRTLDELISVFVKMGYSIAEGPEVESDYYNFEALNFPPNHPARDTQDTLFIANQEQRPQRDRLLLRTHTSPVQIRSMERISPPVRVICPGKVHRNDAPDATHSPVFHQLEGLCVDTNITFGDLKGTLDHAMKSLFGSAVKTSFRPSFFPFTEPSVEVSISCPFCGGKGCRPCKQSGWIELLGAGMVDPNVFGFVGYDPKKFSGFAFGMGVERLTMMSYNVDDIQQFFYGDMRFLEQFAE